MEWYRVVTVHPLWTLACFFFDKKCHSFSLLFLNSPLFLSCLCASLVRVVHGLEWAECCSARMRWERWEWKEVEEYACHSLSCGFGALDWTWLVLLFVCFSLSFCIYIYIYVCACIYNYIYIYMCVCVRDKPKVSNPVKCCLLTYRIYLLTYLSTRFTAAAAASLPLSSTQKIRPKPKLRNRNRALY